MAFDARKVFGERLAELRKNASKSVMELATEVDVNRTTVYNIEKGVENFGINMFVNLVEACGVPFEVFLKGFKKESIPSSQERVFRELAVILDGDYDHLSSSVSTVITAMKNESVRLTKATMDDDRKVRDGPTRPELREEGGIGEGTRQAEEPLTEKHSKPKKRHRRAS